MYEPASVHSEFDIPPKSYATSFLHGDYSVSVNETFGPLQLMRDPGQKWPTKSQKMLVK